MGLDLCCKNSQDNVQYQSEPQVEEEGVGEYQVSRQRLFAQKSLLNCLKQSVRRGAHHELNTSHNEFTNNEWDHSQVSTIVVDEGQNDDLANSTHKSGQEREGIHLHYHVLHGAYHSSLEVEIVCR